MVAHMPNVAHQDNNLVGSAEAAQILGVDRATFNRWVARGVVSPAVSFPGVTGARLFRRADVEALHGDIEAAS